MERTQRNAPNQRAVLAIGKPIRQYTLDAEGAEETEKQSRALRCLDAGIGRGAEQKLVAGAGEEDQGKFEVFVMYKTREAGNGEKSWKR